MKKMHIPAVGTGHGCVIILSNKPSLVLGNQTLTNSQGNSPSIKKRI